MPRQLERSLRNRELVFNVVLFSTGVLMSALLILLLQSFLSGNRVLSRLLIAIAGVGFVGLLRWLSRHARYYVAAYGLVGFYALLAIGGVFAWNIGTPFGILLLGLMIVLSSTILSSRHALYAAALASATVVIVQMGNQVGWLTSHAPGPQLELQLGDAIGQAIVFAVLGTISWLFGREMERSLARAEAAEAELEQDKLTLEVRVARRTEQLKQAQVEEMRQLYRFAEVGQLSTALLHDLANYLTVLTMEIGSMQSKKYTETLARSREVIARLNTILEEVRDRLNKGPVKRQYNLIDIISEVVTYSLQRDRSSPMHITWDPPKKDVAFGFYGDAVKCSQVIAILVGNAMDAYTEHSSKKATAEILVQVGMTDDYIRISVTDWGIGIAPKNRRKIFKSDYSTKEQGMGIGLYLAKQMVTTEFSGTVSLMPATDRTEFVIELPRKKHVS